MRTAFQYYYKQRQKWMLTQTLDLVKFDLTVNVIRFRLMHLLNIQSNFMVHCNEKFTIEILQELFYLYPWFLVLRWFPTWQSICMYTSVESGCLTSSICWEDMLIYLYCSQIYKYTSVYNFLWVRYKDLG